MQADVRRLLLSRRNADGGWGYYPGQTSWLEPTAFAALALHGSEESDGAMKLLSGWQTAAGAWVPHPSVSAESWGTFLAVVLKCARKEFDSSWQRGVEWILRNRGKSFRLQEFINRALGRKPVNILDNSLIGWPWCDGTASWIEPTAHALRALRLSRRNIGRREAIDRIQIGERMIMDRRCVDNGWNYGNKRVLDENLQSFPECTALALIGLCGAEGIDLSASLDRARADWQRPQSPLSTALLRVAMRMHGVPFEDRPPLVTEKSETTQLALALIGEPGGAWVLWKGAGR